MTRYLKNMEKEITIENQVEEIVSFVNCTQITC